MKAYGGRKSIAPYILNIGSRCGERSAWRPGSLTTWSDTGYASFSRRLRDPSAGLEVSEMSESSFFLPGFDPRTVQTVA
jgi:hypothetical protein